MTLNIEGIKVRVDFDKGIPYETLVNIVNEEKERVPKEIGLIEIKHIDGEDFEIVSTAKGEIKRLRRITGYMSEVHSFNPAKQAELADRVAHDKWSAWA